MHCDSEKEITYQIQICMVARLVTSETTALCYRNWTVKMQVNTVVILSFWTDMPGQTVQTQIRLLLEEQSDQDLHCLQFHLHHLDSLLYGRAT